MEKARTAHILQICNMCDREDVMLLCDGCDEGYAKSFFMLLFMHVVF